MCNARGCHIEAPIGTRRIKIRKSAMPATEIFLPGGNGTGRELKEIIVGRVDLVKRSANRRRFAIMKSEGAFYACESCGERYPKTEIVKLLKDFSSAVKCKCGLTIQLEKSDTAVADVEAEAAAKLAEDKKAADAKTKADADAKAAADATILAAAKANDNQPDATAVINLARQERDIFKDKAERLESEVKELRDKVATLEADNKELEEIANENIDRASKELGIANEDEAAAKKKAEEEKRLAEESAKNQ